MAARQNFSRATLGSAHVDLLKNVLLTALMVGGATITAAICCALAMLFNAPAGELDPVNAASAAIGSVVVMCGGVLFGMAFCTVTLFIAALTMPPALGLAHWLRLPRPAVDILGGAVMAYVAAMMAVELIDAESWPPWSPIRRTYSVAVISVFFGGLLGYPPRICSSSRAPTQDRRRAGSRRPERKGADKPPIALYPCHYIADAFDEGAAAGLGPAAFVT